MAPDLKARIAAAAGDDVAALRPLAGGSVGDVRLADLAGGNRVVVKTGGPQAGLDIEGRMLAALTDLSDLPVPRVLHAEPDLLVMTWIDNDGGGIGPGVERDAADALARLHGVTAPAFGFPFDTLIGGLHQPNPETARWTDFFRDRRLLYMAGAARDAGRLDPALFDRIERLGRDLPRWIAEPARPALLHGDMWGGNVLVRNGRLAGFVDPACYFGDPEIELAFSTLFGTFGESFFDRYAELAPFDAEGFFEARRDLYNLYPLLVHARLFGGGYAARVEATLVRFGY